MNYFDLSQNIELYRLAAQKDLNIKMAERYLEILRDILRPHCLHNHRIYTSIKGIGVYGIRNDRRTTLPWPAYPRNALQRSFAMVHEIYSQIDLGVVQHMDGASINHFFPRGTFS